jgi:hypothetical protein
MNIASMINNKVCEANMCHLGFCHIRFDTIARMSILELIPKFNVVKGSKCQLDFCQRSKTSSKTI